MTPARKERYLKESHRWLSILEGCFLVALGIHILASAQLMISGTAGLGLILINITELSFGQIFFLINIPFYILAFMQMGVAFTLRTVISVTLLSCISEILRLYFHINTEQDFMTAIIGGLLVGFGIIILFRHGSSLGGFNIMVLFLEKRFKWHPGKTTFILDIVVVLFGCFVLDFEKVLWSIIGFIALSSVVGRYHRPPLWAKPYPAQVAEMLDSRDEAAKNGNSESKT